MVDLKTKALAAMILAALSALLLAQATFTLFPQEETDMPLPMPQPDSTSQLVWSLQWLGFAVIVSLLILGTILLVKRASTKTNTDKI